MSINQNHIFISENRHVRKNSLFWVLQLLGWTLFSLTLSLTIFSDQITNLKDIIATSITFFLGFTITIILRYVYRIYRVKINSLAWLSILIFITSICFSLIWYLADFLCSMPFMEKEFLNNLNLFRILNGIIFYNLLLLPWSILYFFINFWIEWVIQKKKAENNQFLFKEAQLMMLRYQLNPHFFFNALSSIDVLIDENKELAKNMIYKLSDFLRYSLLADHQLSVTLIDELKMTEKYLDIEKVRFEDDIQFNLEIDPKTNELIIPGFILQTLVENAIKHGMKTTELPLRILIQTQYKPNELTIIIENSGKWIGNKYLSTKISKENSVGLKNVIHRLENEYGSNYELNIIEENGFVKVIIIIKSNKIYGNK